ncbi:hypothetical protein ACIRPT_26525 [Streptomyces sp. NPDC101227]|uniref:hypothetical protein n=1 Tax=Streptomyces sp. NPDC101227 TaxID=3366136 RepID=UPI00382C4D53
MGEWDERLMTLVDDVLGADEERLPLPPQAEARDTIEPLRLLGDSRAGGAFTAGHLASRPARCLPSAG